MNRYFIYRTLAAALAIVLIGAAWLFHGVVSAGLSYSWLGFGVLLVVVAVSGLGLGRLDSGDSYRVVTEADHTLLTYPCGVRAGEHLRLKHDLSIECQDGAASGVVIPSGSVWTVLAGIPYEPDVVWLEQPDGEPHTWDDTVLDDFERCDPPAG